MNKKLYADGDVGEAYSGKASYIDIICTKEGVKLDLLTGDYMSKVNFITREIMKVSF